jgi:Tol biopolymer transport system component
MKTFTQISLLIVLLCACSSQPHQDVTASPILPTATAARTETSQPSMAYTPSFTPTIGSLQQTGTPSADAIKTQTVATIEALYPKCYSLPARDWDSEISPDGRWLTMECRGNTDASDSLQVVSIQGDKVWNIYYGDYAKSSIPSNDFISPIHWSGDGRYIYATTFSGNEGCCWIGGDLSLIRLDLDSGKQEEIVGYSDEGDNSVVGVDFSISPSDRNALYIPQDYKSNLYVLDLTTHQLKVIQIKFENTGAGFILMSKDDKNVVLMLREFPSTPNPNDPYFTYGSIVVINLDTGLQRRLLSGMTFDETPMPARWVDDSHVELSNGNHIWLLDIHTQALTEIASP